MNSIVANEVFSGLKKHIVFILILIFSLLISVTEATCVFALEDGEYSVSVDMEGGSGKASVTSPALLTVRDGIAYAQIRWSSPNYDYMTVDGLCYYNQSEEGMNSVFEIPVLCWDEKMPVIADTTAMGSPIEIEYRLTFYSDSVGSKGELPQEAAKRVLLAAAAIIVIGGILNHFVKKRSC